MMEVSLYDAPQQEEQQQDYYGETASLYSIAEDSREDRASDFPSVSGTDNDDGGMSGNFSNIPAHYDRGDTKVEVQWNVPSSYCSGKDVEIATNSSDPDEDAGAVVPHDRKPYHNSRRCKLFALIMIVLAAIIAVAIGVSVSRGSKAGSPASTTTDRNPEATQPQPEQPQVEDNAASSKPEGEVPSEKEPEVASPPVEVEDNTTPADEDEPVSQGTAAADDGGETEPNNSNVGNNASDADQNDEDDSDPGTTIGGRDKDNEDAWGTPIDTDPGGTASLLVENFVWTALSLCTEESVIMDTSTVQNFVFRQLVNEVSAASTKLSNGLVDIPSDISFNTLTERYALGVFYQSTNGNGWTTSTNWMSNADVCDWYGVSDCNQRAEGSCAVTSLTLSKFIYGGS